MRLPVKFVMKDGTVSDDVIRGHPCVEIGLFFSSTPTEGSSHNTVWAMALVDTGADFLYASPELLNSIGAPVIGSVGDVNGDTSGTAIRQVYLSFRDTKLALQSIAIERDWKLFGGSPYPIVLGRHILKDFKLELDFGNPSACALELKA